MSHPIAVDTLFSSPARLVGYCGSVTVNWAIVAAANVDPAKADPATLLAIVTTAVGVFCAIPAIWNSLVFLWRAATRVRTLRRQWAERTKPIEPKQAG